MNHDNVIDLEERRPHVVIQYQPRIDYGEVHVVPLSWLTNYALGKIPYEPDMDNVLRAIVAHYFAVVN